MIYPAYLLCVALMIPAFVLTALVAAMMLVGKGGLSALFSWLAYFGAGIVEPLQYGWRIAVLLLALVLVVGAGAIPGLRDYAFDGLAVLATLCIAFCFFAASKEDWQNVVNALIVLSPSLAGVCSCLWFGLKFRIRG